MRINIFSFFSHGEPRLSFITDYKRIRPSDKALRQFLFSLSTPEHETSFVDCGFPVDDGKRAYFKHEADDKAAFYSDRFWEIAGDCKRWIRDCTSPEVFFRYFQLYVSTLDKLSFLEKYIQFYDPIPSKLLRKLKNDRSSLECSMIQRSWNSELAKCQKLSTVEGRKKHVQRFFDSFFSFETDFTNEALSFLHQLKETSLSLDLNDIKPAEKPKPQIDIRKENELLRIYRSAPDEMKRHFARNDLIAFYYKYRHDPSLLKKCYDFCIEDIERLHVLDEITRSEATRVFKNTQKIIEPSASQRRNYETTMKRGFFGSIPAFDKLIMIHANDKEYQKAIEYCDMAYKHAKDHGSMAPEYREKKERFKKKLK